MMINGVMTKFTRTDLKVIENVTLVTKAKYENYTQIITEKLEQDQNNEELSLKSGTIILTDEKAILSQRKFMVSAVAKQRKKILRLNSIYNNI